MPAETSFFCDWPENIKDECQDEELIKSSVEFSVEVDLYWDSVMDFLVTFDEPLHMLLVLGEKYFR